MIHDKVVGREGLIRVPELLFFLAVGGQNYKSDLISMLNADFGLIFLSFDFGLILLNIDLCELHHWLWVPLIWVLFWVKELHIVKSESK